MLAVPLLLASCSIFPVNVKPGNLTYLGEADVFIYRSEQTDISISIYIEEYVSEIIGAIVSRRNLHKNSDRITSYTMSIDDIDHRRFIKNVKLKYHNYFYSDLIVNDSDIIVFGNFKTGSTNQNYLTLGYYIQQEDDLSVLGQAYSGIGDAGIFIDGSDSFRQSNFRSLSGEYSYSGPIRALIVNRND